MRNLRWRLLLVAAIVLLAGCRFDPPMPSLPASFGEQMRDWGLAFEVTSESAGLVDPDLVDNMITGDDLVTQLAETGFRFVRSRAVPIFGVLRCSNSVQRCSKQLDVGEARAVWLVLYPDQIGPGGDIGWVLVDAIGRLVSGYDVHDPWEPDE